MFTGLEPSLLIKFNSLTTWGRLSPNKNLVTGWLLEHKSLYSLFITLLISTLRFRESSCEAYMGAILEQCLLFSKQYFAHWNHHCVSLRIFRDAFIVLTRDFCIDINFMSLFCCQLLCSFHSSKLTLGGTNTQFPGDFIFQR